MSGTPPLAVSSSGNFIVDSEGHSIFDACGGAAVSSVGHSHPRVLEAMRGQLDRLAYAHSSFFTSEPAEKLADFLTSNCRGDMSHVYFTSGGSESVETALKLARQYFVEIGQPTRSKFIARFQSYHGNTLGALGVGGNMWRRKMYDPILVEGHHVSPCYVYRGLRSFETLEQYTDRLISETEAMILALGAENVAGFVAEPVVGATLGAVAATPGYFARLREICDRHGVLLILDEVMCGMGRTGTLFAYEQENIVPDIVTIAKGLGGGYAPIGAVMIREVITASPLETIEDAARTLHRHRISSLPVVNAHGDLQGILTETDILYAFVHLLGGMQACSRMEVVVADRPGELARAIRIVSEQLGLNIVSMLVPSAATGEARTAIINVATIDPREALAALQGAGFRVGWPALDNDLSATVPE